MATTALDDFDETLELAKSLLDIESRYKDPPRPGSRIKVAALRGGAAVLMVAALERYLRNLMSEALAELAKDPPPVDAIHMPTDVWVHSVFASLELTMSGPRHGKPSRKQDRLPDVVLAASRVARGRIDPEAFAETKGNPSAHTVKTMCAAAGLRNVYQRVGKGFYATWGKPEAQSFIPDKLDEIVMRRHRVAHGADALSISRTDLGDAARFLGCFASSLDALMTRHVANIVKAGRSAAVRRSRS